MSPASLVAAPGELQRNAEFSGEPGDVLLRLVEEGTQQLYLVPVRQRDGSSEGFGELVPAIGVDGVISGVRA